MNIRRFRCVTRTTNMRKLYLLIRAGNNDKATVELILFIDISRRDKRDVLVISRTYFVMSFGLGVLSVILKIFRLFFPDSIPFNVSTHVPSLITVKYISLNGLGAENFLYAFEKSFFFFRVLNSNNCKL